MSTNRELSKFIGKPITHDVKSKYGATLIPKNKIVTERDVERASKHRVMLPPAPPTQRSKDADDGTTEYRLAVSQTRLDLQQIFAHAQEFDRIPVAELHANVVPAVLKLARSPNINMMFRELWSHDDYTVVHSVAVAVVSVLIGKWLGFPAETLTWVAEAASVHDVGKMKVPLEILNKPGALTADEYALMKRHTEFGYDIIRNTPGLTERHALVALQHHERIDGSGYPHAAKEDQIDYYARVVAIADVFHAMASRRVYSRARPFLTVLQELHSEMFTRLDAPMVLTFLRNAMEMLSGSTVVLDDGAKGRIILVNANDPLRPVVLTDGGIVDLSVERSRNIVELADGNA